MKYFLFLFSMIITGLSFSQSVYKKHMVETGETLYSISKSTNVSVNKIMEYNEMTSQDIFVGQELYLEPVVKKTRTNVEFKNIHVVVKGETLYSLSKKYKISIEELRKLNNLSSDALNEGQKLILTSLGKAENESANTIDKTISPHKTFQKKIVKVEPLVSLHKSNDLRFGMEYCEVLSPYGETGEVVKIISQKGVVCYARIIGKSDMELLGNLVLLKKIGLTEEKSLIKLEYLETK